MGYECEDISLEKTGLSGPSVCALQIIEECFAWRVVNNILTKIDFLCMNPLYCYNISSMISLSYFIMTGSNMHELSVFKNFINLLVLLNFKRLMVILKP